MKTFAAVLALAGAVAAMPAAPSEAAPSGCSPSYSGTFQISVVNVTSSSARLARRQSSQALTLSLSGGILTDASGRTGYIASNNQFQFDKPPQSNAIYTSGFSACSNGTLALGGSAIWYSCLSGTFYNLYDENDAAQCFPVYIDIVGSGSASQQPDGQPTGSPTVATEQPDGQPTASPVSQISDGQPQAPTGTAAPVSQISDGQPQAPTGTVAPVSQISDGQPQAPTGVVSQISDGQPQAPTGGPTAPSNGTSPTVPSVQPYSGNAAATMGPQIIGLAAGALAVLAL